MGLLDFSCKYLTYAFVSNGIWFKENSMIKADILGYYCPKLLFLEHLQLNVPITLVMVTKETFLFLILSLVWKCRLK